MRASELRIGNVVKSLNPIVEYCFIDEIRNGRISAVTRDSQAHALSVWNDGSHQLLPLPLTEEWLLKFGFSKNIVCAYDDSEVTYVADNNHESYTDFVLVTHSGGYFFGEDGNLGVEPSYRQIEYVHQLQNLYFALIGEELTIKYS